jgi:hypothetical protein
MINITTSHLSPKKLSKTVFRQPPLFSIVAFPIVEKSNATDAKGGTANE